MSTETDPTPSPSAPGGITEETDFTVKRLGDEWIIEDNQGASLESGPGRDALVDAAKRHAKKLGATGIRVLNEDGSLDEVVHP